MPTNYNPVPIDFEEMSFVQTIPLNEGIGYVVVHLELRLFNNYWVPSDRFVVILYNSVRVTSFFVERDLEMNWQSDNEDEFVSKELVDWIGKEIETHLI